MGTAMLARAAPRVRRRSPACYEQGKVARFAVDIFSEIRGDESRRDGRFEGGGCAASTVSDYLRFALMLKNKGRLGDAQILSRKTAEFMLSNHLGLDVRNLIAGADPIRADYGFGLSLAVRTQTGVARMMGSPGEFTWPGATGTSWWVDPQEDLAVVFMAHSPGAIRWHYRQLIAALVYRAVAD
jgi:CubicO group peptidase (beta-lactamase class C family)